MNQSDRLAELVRLAREVERAPERAQLGWKRLQSSVNTPSVLTHAEFTSGKPLVLNAGGHWVGVLTIGALGLIGAGGWLAHEYRSRAQRPPSTATASRAAPVSESPPLALPASARTAGEFGAATAAPAPQVPELEPSHPTHSVDTSDKRTPGAALLPKPAVSSGASFEQELRLIKSARERIEQGRASEASALLTEHARSFPHGVFAGEREALRVQLTCKRASVDDRRQLVSTFERTYPQSPYIHRIRRACQSDGEAGGGSR